MALLSPEEQALVLRYLGTGDTELLLALRDRASSPAFADFLAVLVGAVAEPPDPRVWVDTVANVVPTAAQAAPANLEDAWLRSLFLAPWLPGLAVRLDSDLSARATHDALAIATAFGVTPLEARVKDALGYGLIGHDDRTAELYSRDSSELYARLAEEDAEFWGEHLSRSLNTLGGALRAQGKLKEAADVFRHALSVAVAARRPDEVVLVSDRGPRAAALDGFERSLVETSRALGEELGVIGVHGGRVAGAHAGVVERKSLAPQLLAWWDRVTTAEHNLGDVLRELRRFPDARRYLRSALRMRLQMSAADGKYRFKVIRTLINLGRSLREEGKLERARTHLRRGLALLPALDPHGRPTHEERGLLLQNLANVVGDLEEHAAAVEFVERAVEAFRLLADEQPSVKTRGRLVAAQIDQLAALVEAGRGREARARLPRTLEEARESADDPAGYLGLARALSNAAAIFRMSGDEYPALAAAEEAISLEASCGGSERQVLRGHLAGAYVHAAQHYARYGRERMAFAYLAALRAAEPRGVQMGDLDAAARELESASAAVGRRVVVVSVQRAGPELLFGVLKPGGSFACELQGGLPPSANELVGTYQELLFPELAWRARRRLRPLSGVAEDFWGRLPSLVRETLLSDSLVLIDADQEWSNFPWELVKPPGRPFLGLTRVLSRWHGIDAAALARLRPVERAVDSRSFAVLCPLCGPEGEPPTKNPGSPSMAREYRFVCRHLRRLGVSFSIDVNVLYGYQGRKRFFLEALGESPTLVHFIGHGYPARGGSLVAWGEWGSEVATIDADDLREYREARRQEQLFGRGGIGYLSCCSVGLERRHGGLGEDLCSALLSEGLDFVVASLLPIYEGSAGEMARTFYQWLVLLAADAGTAVVKARRRMAKQFERTGDCSFLTWGSLRCLGNPLTSLVAGPRIRLPRPKVRRARARRARATHRES